MEIHPYIAVHAVTIIPPPMPFAEVLPLDGKQVILHVMVKRPQPCRACRNRWKLGEGEENVTQPSERRQKIYSSSDNYSLLHKMRVGTNTFITDPVRSESFRLRRRCAQYSTLIRRPRSNIPSSNTHFFSISRLNPCMLAFCRVSFDKILTPASLGAPSLCIHPRFSETKVWRARRDQAYARTRCAAARS